MTGSRESANRRLHQGSARRGPRWCALLLGRRGLGLVRCQPCAVGGACIPNSPRCKTSPD